MTPQNALSGTETSTLGIKSEYQTGPAVLGENRAASRSCRLQCRRNVDYVSSVAAQGQEVEIEFYRVPAAHYVTFVTDQTLIRLFVRHVSESQHYLDKPE